MGSTYSSISRTLHRLAVYAIFFVLIACFATLFALTGCHHSVRKKLTFALPVADWWTAAPFINSKTASCFEDAGVQIAVLEVNSGLASKNAVVAGTADIGLSAATPLALAAARQEQVAVLATYLRSNSIVGLVRPSAVPNGQFPAEPVAIVPSTISESFLYQYLDHIGQRERIERKQIKELNLRPADIPAALQNGAAKSAAIWEPFLSFAQLKTGLVREKDVPQFEVNLYLLTRPAFLKEHPDEVRAFLEGVNRSCRYLRDNSEKGRREIERHFDFNDDFLAPAWPNVSYSVDTDYTRMKVEILREATAARALGYIVDIPNVDYLFNEQR